MQEHYFHTADPASGGLVRTDRLRSVDRTAEDGRKLRASKRGDDGINLQLETRNGSRVEDVLTADERVSLAKLLLSDLPIDQVRNALPAELFDTDWAIQLTDSAETWSSYEDGILFASREAAAADLASHNPPEPAAGRVLRREISEWMEG